MGERKIKVVFVGNPNTGKSTLINALSGSRLKVGNWSGTTVERLFATVTHRGIEMELIDLPGTYDILPNNLEESITFRELFSDVDVVVNVLDAGNLERNLHVTLELTEMGVPMVVVLNMVDEVEKKGLKIHPEVLESILGVPVLTTVAVKGVGIKEILNAIPKARIPKPVTRYSEDIERAARDVESLIRHRAKRWMSLALLTGEWDGNGLPDTVKRKAKELRNRFKGRDIFLEIEGRRFEEAKRIAEKVLDKGGEYTLPTERLDRFVLNPIFGVPIFLIITVLTFRFTFTLSAPWVDFIGTVQDILSGWVASSGFPRLLQSFLIDGVIGGVGTVLSFVPVLFLLYLAISFLEQVGILSRAAFLLDSLFSLFGLPGNAFVPLVLGFGCNVPAVYATRTLDNFQDRLRVGLVIPFMNCSARLTVLAFFAAVFFPRSAPYILLFLYVLGLALALITAVILKGIVKGGGSSVFELPPYRMPPLSYILRQAWYRTSSFIKRAGGTIFAAVVLIWALLNFPSPDNSLYVFLSEKLVGLFSIIGIRDWRLVGSLIPGFIAKEVVLGSLAVSYFGFNSVQALDLFEGLRILLSAFGTAVLQTLKGIPMLFWVPGFEIPASGGKLGDIMSQVLTYREALSYMVFILLYTPCVATVSAIKQEFGGKWAYISIAYQLVVAFTVAWMVYSIVGLLG